MNPFRKTFFFFGLVLLGLAAAALADPPAQSSDLAAKKTDDGTLFQCSGPGATAVYLAGDFNNWAEDHAGVISDAKYKMDGARRKWALEENRHAGGHKFKFSIGGVAEGWFAPDWAKKDSEGNGLITITSEGAIAVDAAMAPAPAPASADSGLGQGWQTVTFHYTAPGASTVYLAGDFNSWGENKDGGCFRSEIRSKQKRRRRLANRDDSKSR